MMNEPKETFAYKKSARNIIIFLHYYLPGYESGGPLRSIANIVESLGEEFNFLIVTCNHDLLNRTPYPEVPNDCWTGVGKANVWYISGRLHGLLALMRELHHFKGAVLYLNSLFDPCFSFIPLLVQWLGVFRCGKVILAPRGELSAGALKLKPTKKKIFLMIFRALKLDRKVSWHASTDMEQQDIVKFFIGRSVPDISVASDLSLPLSPSRECERNKDLVFLSRISRMKNLDYVLRVLVECKEPVSLHIYGTVEDATYWQECQTVMEHLPTHIRVVFHGAVSPANVSEVLSKHGLFFLPSRGENYGHVIAEALSSGLPVLISNQTPWGDVATYGAGWVLPLDDIKAFARVIDRFMLATLGERQAQADAVREYARMNLCRPEILDANRRLFA